MNGLVVINSTMNSSSSKAVEKRLKKADVRVVWKKKEETNEKEGEKNSVSSKKRQTVQTQ